MIDLIHKQKSKILNTKYNRPSDRIRVIGVTGTYGKTIVSHLIHHALKEVGFGVGYITSIGYSANGINHHNFPTSNSATEGEILKILDLMTKNGMHFAVVEIPPKSLVLGKINGLTFDTGIITNIRAFEDSIEEVLESKLRFIKNIREGGLIVLNEDEGSYIDWISSKQDKIEQNIEASLVSSSNIFLLNRYVDGTRFLHENNHFIVPFAGNYNAFNAMLAIKALNHYIDLESIKKAFESFKTPPGRMEFVVKNNPFTVIIDYAYNPEMMDKSLSYLKMTKPMNSKLITVFGCAGERDKNRRLMGSVAAKYSDLVVLTAEDPKSERVADINSQIHKHAQVHNGVIAERFMASEEYQMIDKSRLRNRIQRISENGDIPFITFDADHYSGRLDAIDFAINYADASDIVYITGKGHERSLFFNNIEYEWSDHEAVKQSLKNRLT